MKKVVIVPLNGAFGSLQLMAQTNQVRRIPVNLIAAERLLYLLMVQKIASKASSCQELFCTFFGQDSLQPDFQRGIIITLGQSDRARVPDEY